MHLINWIYKSTKTTGLKTVYITLLVSLIDYKEMGGGEGRGHTVPHIRWDIISNFNLFRSVQFEQLQRE